MPLAARAPELTALQALEPVRAEVSAGLDRVFSDVPVGTGYLQLSAGASSHAGPYARAEAGYRPLQDLAAFGFAEANRGGVVGGAGVRLRW